MAEGMVLEKYLRATSADREDTGIGVDFWNPKAQAHPSVLHFRQGHTS